MAYVRLEKKGAVITLEEDSLIIACSTQNRFSSEKRFFDLLEAGIPIQAGFYDVSHPAIHLELLVDSSSSEGSGS